MTYQEAVEMMKSGKRVRHAMFTSEEYFEMQHGTIIDENGYNMTCWYKGQGWQDTDWFVVERQHREN